MKTKENNEEGIIKVWTSPISPALEEAYKFQHFTLKCIGILILLIGIIFIINNVSAIDAEETIYAGETIYYDFTNECDEIQNITWEVTDNSSNLDGLNITKNSTGAIVSIAQNFKPDNFTIIFTITGTNGQVEVVKSTGQQSGGGSSYSKPKVNDTIEINETIEEPEEIEEIIEGNQGEETSKGKYRIAKIVVLIIALIILIGMLYLKFIRKEEI